MSDGELFTVSKDADNGNYKVEHKDSVRAIFADENDAVGYADHKNYQLDQQVKNLQYVDHTQKMWITSLWCGLGDSGDIHSLFIDWAKTADAAKEEFGVPMVGEVVDINNKVYNLYFEDESGKFWYDNHPSRVK